MQRSNSNLRSAISRISNQTNQIVQQVLWMIIIKSPPLEVRGFSGSPVFPSLEPFHPYLRATKYLYLVLTTILYTNPNFNPQFQCLHNILHHPNLWGDISHFQQPLQRILYFRYVSLSVQPSPPTLGLPSDQLQRPRLPPLSPTLGTLFSAPWMLTRFQCAQFKSPQLAHLIQLSSPFNLSWHPI